MKFGGLVRVVVKRNEGREGGGRGARVGLSSSLLPFLPFLPLFGSFHPSDELKTSILRKQVYVQTHHQFHARRAAPRS